MVMLPRNMISPMVSPSAGTGCIVSGSITVHAFLQQVGHALAAVAAHLLLERQLRPLGMLRAHRRRPVGLGEAVDVRDVEAHLAHALDHRGGRRRGGHQAMHLVVDARASIRPGALISIECTIGAPQ